MTDYRLRTGKINILLNLGVSGVVGGELGTFRMLLLSGRGGGGSIISVGRYFPGVATLRGSKLAEVTAKELLSTCQ